MVKLYHEVPKYNISLSKNIFLFINNCVMYNYAQKGRAQTQHKYAWK